jgi:hypothetical protein
MWSGFLLVRNLFHIIFQSLFPDKENFQNSMDLRYLIIMKESERRKKEEGRKRRKKEKKEIGIRNTFKH